MLDVDLRKPGGSSRNLPALIAVLFRPVVLKASVNASMWLKGRLCMCSDRGLEACATPQLLEGSCNALVHERTPWLRCLQIANAAWIHNAVSLVSCGLRLTTYLEV